MTNYFRWIKWFRKYLNNKNPLYKDTMYSWQEITYMWVKFRRGKWTEEDCDWLESITSIKLIEEDI